MTSLASFRPLIKTGVISDNKYFDGLNLQQNGAIEEVGKRLLIIAGAGSGKDFYFGE